MGFANKIETDPVMAAAIIFLYRGGSSPGFRLGHRAFLTYKELNRCAVYMFI
jgi:hypothetical protein